MDPTTSMKVRLKDLPLERRVVLDNEFVRAALADDPLYQALERPGDDPHAGAAEADLSLYLEGADVFVRGRLEGWLEVACSRCVGTVRVPLEEQLAATFMPREHVPDDPGADEEVELTEDDLDLFPYEGEEVDLEPMLREQIVLGVPYAPLCAEDCKGLCPQCGGDRNLNPCECEAPGDPRLAALKDIKL